jgi:uncharacterized protein YjbI with pentapeptide repeats
MLKVEHGTMVKIWTHSPTPNPIEVLQLYAAGERRFSEADLIGAELPAANLSGADFSYADLSAANLKDADLRGVDFSYANLGAANLQRADLRGAILLGANLSSADLGETLLGRADYDGDTHFPAGFEPVSVGMTRVN